MIPGRTGRDSALKVLVGLLSGVVFPVKNCNNGSRNRACAVWKWIACVVRRWSLSLQYLSAYVDKRGTDSSALRIAWLSIAMQCTQREKMTVDRNRETREPPWWDEVRKVGRRVGRQVGFRGRTLGGVEST